MATKAKLEEVVCDTADKLAAITAKLGKLDTLEKIRIFSTTPPVKMSVHKDDTADQLAQGNLLASSLPDFWTASPAAWFGVTEAKFLSTHQDPVAAMLTAFNVAKNSLTTTADLPHPSPQAKLALVADASATHVGAALHQQRRPGGPWEPLGFFSKKMDSTQATVLLTGSFLLPSAPSGTSGSKWKATISSFGQPSPPHLCSGLLL